MSGTATDSFTPGRLNSLFIRSITDAVAAVGDDIGLAALDWNVRIENGEIIVLGAPPRHASEPMTLCRDWARALGLDDGYYDASEDVSSWSRVDGPWLIEISTLVD
jgi:hypothetical protein